MPIQNYLCRDCNRIYEFLFPTSEDPRQPRCPRCGAAPLDRQLAQFAFVRGGKNPLAAIPKTDAEVLAEGEAHDPEAPELDEGLYKLWEHCVEAGSEPERASGRKPPVPRRRMRVNEAGEQEERPPEG